MNDRRVGKFFISHEMIEENPALVQLTLRDVIIVHARLNWNGFIEYEGLHPAFEEVPLGSYPPSYTAMFRRQDDPEDPSLSVVTVEWVKA